MKFFYQKLFWLLILIGRPFGGFRPRRILYYCAHRGYDLESLKLKGMAPIDTCWGGKIYGHPYYHLDRDIIINGYYDESLHSLLEKKIKPNSTVFDIGANIGEVSLHMAYLVGSGGRVYAFEPAPSLYLRLTDNISVNNFQERILVSRVALSNKSGYQSFAVAAEDQENQGMGSLINMQNDVVSHTITVQTQTLDSFVKEFGVQNIDFMKIDIQGSEYAFIEGAKNVLTTMGPDLVIEISESDLSCAEITPKDLLELLFDIGYRIFSIDDYGIVEKEINRFTVSHKKLTNNVFCTKN